MSACNGTEEVISVRGVGLNVSRDRGRGSWLVAPDDIEFNEGALCGHRVDPPLDEVGEGGTESPSEDGT